MAGLGMAGWYGHSWLFWITPCVEQRRAGWTWRHRGLLILGTLILGTLILGTLILGTAKQV